MTDTGRPPAGGCCGHCRKPLPDNTVSDYFCGQGCQDLWSRGRSEPVDEVRLWLRWRDAGREPTAMSCEY